MQRFEKYYQDCLVFFTALGFFLFTMVANFSGPHDAINYLNGIVKGKDLFHQHHLLYHISAHTWFVFWKQIFTTTPAYYLVESFTAFFGALNCWIIFRIFKDKFQIPHSLYIAFILVIIFSYGMWLYSTNVEVYAPPIFFLLCTLYFLGNKDLTQNIFAITILHSLAILYHQVHVIFAVVVVWKLLSKKAFIAFFIYAALGVLMVGSVYFFIGWVIENNRSIEKFWFWLTGYAHSDFYWQKPGLEMLIKIFTGFSHAYIGGHFIFQLEFIQQLFLEYRGHSLADEIYLVRNLSTGLALLLSLCTLIFAGLFIYFNVLFFKDISKLRVNRHPIFGPLLIATLSYSLFFCFWMPEILEFWIFQSITIWIILFASAYVHGRFKKKITTYAVYLIAVLLFCINWFGSLRYMQNLKNDLYYVKTEKLKSVLTSETTVIFQDGWLLKDFVDYFTGATVYVAPQPEEDINTTNQIIQKTITQQKPLLIFPEKNNYGLIQSTHYIDSLLLQYQTQWKLIQEENPRVLQLN